MTRYDRYIITKILEKKFSFYRRLQSRSKSRELRILITLLLSPFALYSLILSRRRFVLPYVEIVLTERCNLRCKDCANLMQHYSTPQNYSLERIIRDVDDLGKKVHEIYICRLLGGEPLIHPEFGEILRQISARKFIKRIDIVTNGTVLPHVSAIDALKKDKVKVSISDYGERSFRLAELTSLLDREKIFYELNRLTDWQDYGDLSNKNLSEDELSCSYRTCGSANCKTLMSGYLYTCPRSAHMCNLGLLSTDEEGLKIAEITSAMELRDFYNREYFYACAYCLPPDRREKVTPALQAERE